MDQLNYANTFEINDEAKELLEREDNKKPIITFSKLNRYFIIPFLCPIFYYLSKFFRDLIGDTNVINKTEFLDSITAELSFIFSGLFYFISYFKVNFDKKNISSQFIERNNTEAIDSDNKNKICNYNSCKIVTLIILLSLIILMQDFLYIFIIGHNIFEEKTIFKVDCICIDRSESRIDGILLFAIA